MRSSLMILPLAALMACGGGSSATGPSTTGGSNTGASNTGGTGAVATTAVKMEGLSFTPSAIKVGSGATVTWTNSDGVTHNVTFDNAATLGITGSGTAVGAGGNAALVMPAAAGTYAYHCTLHAGMTGSVQVQ